MDANPSIYETPPSLDEVREAVTELKGEKAAGACNSSTEFLKAIGKVMACELRAALSAVWQYGTFLLLEKRAGHPYLEKKRGPLELQQLVLSKPGKVFAHLLPIQICDKLL